MQPSDLVVRTTVSRCTDLENHVALAPERSGIGHNIDALLPIGIVRETGLRAGAGLDGDVEAQPLELCGDLGRRCDAPLLWISLFGNTDSHTATPASLTEPTSCWIEDFS